MRQVFLDFHKQFAYQPVIRNKQKYKKADRFIILGMGGSALAQDIIKNAYPNINIVVHKDYDLPKMTDQELKKHLLIANSYSGNTEEVLDGLKAAYKKKLNIIVIATGAKLIKFAQKNKLPYIQMPNFGIQPRCALGFNARALAKAMSQTKLYQELGDLAKNLKGKNYEKAGKKLAKELKNKVPIIYASATNQIAAYLWKIKLNETGKIPAFCNFFPELNHNEMTGFDVAPITKPLSQKFSFIILRDDKDHKRNQKRMDILSKLYKKRGFKIINIKLAGQNQWFKIFANALLADWTAYYLSQSYGLEAEQVPMVEDFKKLL
ncbi:MAG: SIS domain-containing protein [Patescibacteria group bacterium]|nr:SIS domain-containing protein [Patescibacteria group bacterium]